MAYARYTIVTDAKGIRGVVDPQQVASGSERVTILLQTGQEVRVRAADLVQRDNGTYYIPHSLSDVDTDPIDSDAEVEAVIPVIEEAVNVDKQWVETGRVRITRRSREEEQVINAVALHEEVDVQRVPINQPISGPVDARYEGDTLVIPVVEEVVVVEKRLVLKEELRVTRRRVETPVEQPVTVRKDEVIVEHLPLDDQP
jgi:uncharacterized protein (TIGR02271 family)